MFVLKAVLATAGALSGSPFDAAEGLLTMYCSTRHRHCTLASMPPLLIEETLSGNPDLSWGSLDVGAALCSNGHCSPTPVHIRYALAVWPTQAHAQARTRALAQPPSHPTMHPRSPAPTHVCAHPPTCSPIHTPTHPCVSTHIYV